MESRSDYPTLYTSVLIPWDKNRRSISKENFALLKDKLEKKRQFKPFFVSPLGDGTYTVLAGNMRLRAYQELGVEKVWVSILEFIERDNLWYVIKDGVEESERFPTKEDAMLDWSLSENEVFGNYEWDSFANDIDGYSLDWSRYLAGAKKQTSIKSQLSQFLMGEEDKPEKETPMVTCPTCGAQFYNEQKS